MMIASVNYMHLFDGKHSIMPELKPSKKWILKEENGNRPGFPM